MSKTTDRYYDQLLLIYKNNSELTFNNEGYQYLSKEIIEKNKLQIEEISDILKVIIEGFVKFNNFKIGKKGGINVRCQRYYDRANGGFIDVGYFDLKDFKSFEENE